MEANSQNSFGKWLKKRRKALDLTQYDLAKRIGCAKITLQKIEADQRRPSKQMAELLAEQLGIAETEHLEFVRFARMESNTRCSFIPRNGMDKFPRNFSLRNLTNIPLQPSPLIGRDQDEVFIRKRLLDEDVRLLTLTGPPGVGKTRLAIQVALGLLETFEDGVYFISLATVSDPDVVATTIAQTLGVNQVGERSFSYRLKEYLSDKQMLLVLDNLEQVITCAPFIAELLSECPWVSILITSRTPLFIRGERQFPVPPLTLPDKEDTKCDLLDLMRFSAIALFVDRAQAANPGFVLGLKNSRTISAICMHLDGLPLAIELAAARVNFLSPQVLLEQISGKHLLHTDGLRDTSERHRTLYHAIDWSYALLTSEQQLLLSRLSVFNNGWTLAAAEKIMVDQPLSVTLELLKVLVDNNLVVQYESCGELRFTLLETIRTYASERLVTSGEENEHVHQWHAEYYLSLAEEADPYLRTAAQQVWLDRLEVERGNFRAALTWLTDICGDIEKGMRLAGALGWFWSLRSYVSEGRGWLDRILHSGGDVHRSAARVKALNAAGVLAWEQSDLNQARTYLEECITLCRELGPGQTWNLAMSLGNYGNVVMYLNGQQILRCAAEESYELFNQVGDRWGMALALCLIGEVHLLKHDYTRARSCFEDASLQLRKTGDKWAIGISLMDLGYTNSLLGNLDDARSQFNESIALHCEIGERFVRSLSLNCLAQVVQQQGDFQLAVSCYSKSLELLREMGIEARIADVQYNLAHFVQDHGYYQLASKLYRECLGILSVQGNEDGVAKCQAGLAAIGNINDTSGHETKFY